MNIFTDWNLKVFFNTVSLSFRVDPCTLQCLAVNKPNRRDVVILTPATRFLMVTRLVTRRVVNEVRIRSASVTGRLLTKNAARCTAVKMSDKRTLALPWSWSISAHHTLPSIWMEWIIVYFTYLLFDACRRGKQLKCLSARYTIRMAMRQPI